MAHVSSINNLADTICSINKLEGMIALTPVLDRVVFFSLFHRRLNALLASVAPHVSPRLFFSKLSLYLTKSRC